VLAYNLRMSVFATNRFAILPDDDVDSDEAVRIPVQVVNKEEKAAPVPPAKEPKASRKIEAPSNKEVRPKSDTRNVDNRRPLKEDQADDSNDGKESAQANGSPGQDRFERTQQNRRPGGDRQRRDRQSDTGAGGGTERRVFDRRSGTGRGREEKRGGAGRGNWGAPNDEEKYVEPTNDEKPGDAVAAAVADDDGWGSTPDPIPAPVAQEHAAPGADEQQQQPPPTEAPPKREPTAEELAYKAEREKEEKQMTLDEYLKTRKPVPLALPEARKAGEGEDNSQWGKFVAAGKSDKHPATVEEAKQPAGKLDKKSSTNINKVPALLRFKSDAADRRNKERREARDRFRGEQDQHPDRPDRPDRPERRATAPRTNQPARAVSADFALPESDFPALGAVKS